MANLSERLEVRIRGRDHTVVFLADSEDGRLVIRQEPDGKTAKDVCCITLSDPDELRPFFKGLRRIVASLEHGNEEPPPLQKRASLEPSRSDDRDALVTQARARNAQAFAPWTKEEEQDIKERQTVLVGSHRSRPPVGHCSQFSYPGRDNHPALLSTRLDLNGFVDDRQRSRLPSDPAWFGTQCATHTSARRGGGFRDQSSGRKTYVEPISCAGLGALHAIGPWPEFVQPGRSESVSDVEAMPGPIFGGPGRSSNSVGMISRGRAFFLAPAVVLGTRRDHVD
jgi:hypothetical protein